MSADTFTGDADFDAVLVRCRDLLKVKGADYETDIERDEADIKRVSNFIVESRALGLTPFQVLGVYMHKHQRAIDKYLRDGRVESEPIEERICDNVNYLLLLQKLINVLKKHPELVK